MNKAQKKFFKVKKLSEIYNDIETTIAVNQETYEERMKTANGYEDEISKKYEIEYATKAIEENEALTELLNEIYKLM